MYHATDSYDDVLTVKGKRAARLAHTESPHKKPKHKKLSPYKRERVQVYPVEEPENLIPFWEESVEIKPLLEEIIDKPLMRVCLHGPYRQAFVFDGGLEENWYVTYDPVNGWEICFIPF